jgi:hypothetical protein
MSLKILNMKKTIFYIVGCMTAGVIQAQTNDPSSTNTVEVQQIRQTLVNAGASSAEVTQFLDARTTYAHRASAIHQDTTLTTQARSQQLQLIYTEKNTQYKTILGSEKYRKYNHLKVLPLSIQATEKNKPSKTDILRQLLITAGATATQASDFLTFKQFYVEKMKALNQNTSGTAQQHKNAKKQLQDEKDIKYKQLLGNQVFKEYIRLKRLSEVDD